MADEADRANDELLESLDRRLEEMKADKQLSLPFWGHCLCCGEDVTAHFCDDECRDLWQELRNADKRGGRAMRIDYSVVS